MSVHREPSTAQPPLPVLIARRSVGAVRIATLVAVVVGIAFWGILVSPLAFSAWWQFPVAGLLMVTCVLPALVLGLLYLGLRQLLHLPTKVLESIRQGRNQASEVANTFRAEDLPQTGRGLGLFRGLWLLWKTVAESRDLLLGAAALVRLANPVALAVVLAAFAASFLEALFVLGFWAMRVIL